MLCLIVASSLILLVLQQEQFTQAATLRPVEIPTDGKVGVCPVHDQEKRESDAIIQKIKADIMNIIKGGSLVYNCGEGLWYQVAYLNMSDPSQQCPSVWREYNSNGIRTCSLAGQGCRGNIYNINRHYLRICGRVIGYQVGNTDGFRNFFLTNLTIDQSYLHAYGVSITRGLPRVHVWSYSAGASEQGSCGDLINCPCSSGGPAPPSFVGNNFYCESAYQGDCFEDGTFFVNDKLWDGQQCNNEGTCCTGDGINTPPWFSVTLSNPTRDDIEVRICHDQHSDDEDTPIQLLEIYVQ